jgi:proprotein convertase subtilisin/kexin type 5
MCSRACNQTHIYYNIDKTCALSCVDGTFLLGDQVSCQACSTQCLTCFNIGTNCTSCFKKFWYNYQCVDNCPTNYYADSSSKCQYCGNNNEYCQLPPLSYTVTTYT